jgi:hypothetical protein
MEKNIRYYIEDFENLYKDAVLDAGDGIPVFSFYDCKINRIENLEQWEEFKLLHRDVVFKTSLTKDTVFVMVCYVLEEVRNIYCDLPKELDIKYDPSFTKEVVNNYKRLEYENFKNPCKEIFIDEIKDCSLNVDYHHSYLDVDYDRVEKKAMNYYGIRKENKVLDEELRKVGTRPGFRHRWEDKYTVNPDTIDKDDIRWEIRNNILTVEHKSHEFRSRASDISNRLHDYLLDPNTNTGILLKELYIVKNHSGFVKYLEELANEDYYLHNIGFDIIEEKPSQTRGGATNYVLNVRDKRTVVSRFTELKNIEAIYLNSLSKRDCDGLKLVFGKWLEGKKLTEEIIKRDLPTCNKNDIINILTILR